MKNIFFSIVLTFATITLIFSQEKMQKQSEYQKLLEKDVRELDIVKSKEDIKDVLYKFERLRKLAPDEWLPSYYSAYCKIVLTKWEDNKEDLTNESLAQLEDIEKTTKNSEIITLLARVYMKKVELKRINGPKYTGKVKNLLKKAIEMDDSNPRTYLVYGRFYFYFPQFVGGDKVKAKKFFKKAKLLFDSEHEQKQKKYSSMPHWGKKLNEWHLKNFN